MDWLQVVIELWIIKGNKNNINRWFHTKVWWKRPDFYTEVKTFLCGGWFTDQHNWTLNLQNSEQILLSFCAHIISEIKCLGSFVARNYFDTVIRRNLNKDKFWSCIYTVCFIRIWLHRPAAVRSCATFENKTLAMRKLQLASPQCWLRSAGAIAFPCTGPKPQRGSASRLQARSKANWLTQLDFSVFSQQHVLSFDVAVNDMMSMQVS